MNQAYDLASQREQRLEKAQQLRELGINPFPSTVNKNTQNAHIEDNYDELENSTVTIGGRVRSWRAHGKVVFTDLYDQTGKAQAYIRFEDLKKDLAKGYLGWDELGFIDDGDFIEVTGQVTKTQKGEPSVLAQHVRILAKTLRPIPDDLENKELRYRRRYLDLILHPDIRERFERKAKFWQAHRDFLQEQGFIEVETPVLEHVTGGADARPFVTHHNDLDEDFYLRISTELYQKRLIGGGFEKIFTIGPNFRNEGVSDEHLQEYYQAEWYWAYADYRDNMALVRDLFRYVAQEVYGTTKFSTRGHDFDLSDEWEEIDYVKVIKDRFNIDIFSASEEEMAKILEENDVHLDGDSNRNRLVDNLWKIIRKDISGPAFLINEPKFMSPLAKSRPDNEKLTERFHVIIGGSELGNGYTEINDPVDQLERFVDQQRLRESGDDEAQMMDIDFVEMLEYGMPPTSGYGQSERIFWFLEDVTAREGTLFPLMKKALDHTTEKIYSEHLDLIASVAEHDAGSKESLDIRSDTEYTIQQQFSNDFPGIFYAYVLIRDVNVKKQNEKLEQLKQEVIKSVKKKSLDETTSTGPIASYRSLFKATGTDFHSKKPSPEALLSRVTKGKGLYTINTAVDAYNVAVLETEIGLGGFDYAKVKEPVTLRYSKEGEEMNLLGDENQTKLRDGQIVYADQESPITLDLNYRDIDRTKITEETKDIILFADGAPGISEKEVIDALTKGARYIQEFCGGELSLIYVVKANDAQTKAKGSGDNKVDSNLPSRDEAEALLQEHVDEEYQLLHAHMVATVLESYAADFNEDPNLWYITGLLHDLDYTKHPDEHPNLELEWFKEWGYPEALIHAVAAHAPKRTDVHPQTKLASALMATDELSGLMYAYALMRDGGFEGMKAKGVKKKLKDKSFAAKIDRDEINTGIELLNVDVSEHIDNMITIFAEHFQL